MFIYVLRHPKTKNIRYVGQTTEEPNSRLSKHICAARRGSDFPVCRWILKLLRNDFRPEIKVIDDADSEAELNKKEKLYIEEYRQKKDDLLNVADGGREGFCPWEGITGEDHPRWGCTHTEETKNRMSREKKKYYKENPEAREHLSKINIGRPCPEHVKELFSEIYSGKGNPFYGKAHTKEARKKMSENHADVSKENNPFYGKEHTEESKQKMSESKNKLYEENPEIKERIADSLRGRTLPEETKNKISQTLSSTEEQKKKAKELIEETENSYVCSLCGRSLKTPGGASSHAIAHIRNDEV